jgi:cytochrome c biogenesis protein CcmG, thiol:disulfide interchange protein DsbE
MNKRWIGAVALLVLLLQAALMTGRATAAPELAPQIELIDYEGTKHKLSDFRGQTVLLNFWASWCGPCREEMPELARLARQYEGKVRFIGVNLAVRDDVRVSKALLKKVNVPYLNLLDQQGKAAIDFRVQAIPTTLLIDPDGKVVGRVLGANVEGVRALLQKVAGNF